MAKHPQAQARAANPNLQFCRDPGARSNHARSKATTTQPPQKFASMWRRRRSPNDSKQRRGFARIGARGASDAASAFGGRGSTSVMAAGGRSARRGYEAPPQAPGDHRCSRAGRGLARLVGGGAAAVSRRGVRRSYYLFLRWVRSADGRRGQELRRSLGLQSSLLRLPVWVGLR
jgi:hypothetical protein